MPAAGGCCVALQGGEEWVDREEGRKMEFFSRGWDGSSCTGI